MIKQLKSNSFIIMKEESENFIPIKAIKEALGALAVLNVNTSNIFIQISPNEKLCKHIPEDDYRKLDVMCSRRDYIQIEILNNTSINLIYCGKQYKVKVNVDDSFIYEEKYCTNFKHVITSVEIKFAY